MPCVFCLRYPAPQEEDYLRIENGMLQPVLSWADLWDEDCTNGDSGILRFCVWVETDYDTDPDGKADLVKALIQVPRAAAEGRYRAGVIYDPTPCGAGTVERYSYSISGLYNKEIFDQSLFYRPCEKREPAGSMISPEAAAQADPGRRNCRTPDSDREDLDGIMIAAVMMDVSDGGVFPTYSAAAVSGSAVETVELEDQLYDSGTGMGLIAMQACRQADKPR